MEQMSLGEVLRVLEEMRNQGQRNIESFEAAKAFVKFLPKDLGPTSVVGVEGGRVGFEWNASVNTRLFVQFDPGNRIVVSSTEDSQSSLAGVGFDMKYGIPDIILVFIKKLKAAEE